MSYNKNAHKILSFSSFIVLLIISFLIITKFYNLSSSETSIAGIFVLIGLVLIVGLTQTIQIMNLTKEKIRKEDYTKKSYLTEIDEYEEGASKEKQNQEEKSEEEQIDIDGIANKILPENDKNTELSKYTEKLLANIAKEYDIVQGLFYYRTKGTDTFTIASKYAYYGEEEPQDFEIGETLSGQTAKNQKVLNLAQIPENYITILSGLGSSSPECLLFVPVIQEGKTLGLMELASFKVFSKKTERTFSQLSERIGEKISDKIT
jgi:putative methionine-R-sulfoxide reductase with GAF domain